MKKVTYLMLALVVAFFVSCNKDQKVAKELEGTWKLTSYTVNGVADPNVASYNATYTFTKCKVKKEDCDGTLSFAGLTFPFKYKITDKGTKYTMTTTMNGTTETESGTITEHSKSKVVFTSVEDGDTYVSTLTK